jgi:hypothetical protein
MLAMPRATSLSSRLSIVRHLVLSVETHRPVEFVDLTPAVSAAV